MIDPAGAHRGEPRLAGVDVSPPRSGGGHDLLRRLAAERHGARVEVHAETILGDPVHELDHLPRRDQEVAPVGGRIGLDQEPHAAIGGPSAEFAKERQGDGLGLGEAEAAAKAILRRAEHQPRGAKARRQVDDRGQVGREAATGRGVSEQHEIAAAEEQGLHRHDRQAAILPESAVGDDAAGRRLPGPLADPRRHRLHAAHAVRDEHRGRFRVGLGGPGDGGDG